MSKIPLMPVIEQAQRCEAQGDVAGALRCYREWLDSADADRQFRHVALFNLGCMLRTQGDLPQSIACYEEALRLKPDFHQAVVNLGLALEAAGDQTKALAVWQAALQPKEIQTLLLNHSGRVYEQARLYDEAEDRLRRSLLLDPEQPPVVQHCLHIRQKKCRWPVIDHVAGIAHETLVDYCGPLAVLALTDDPAIQLRSVSSWVKRHIPRDLPRLAAAGGYRHERIRLGYISCDFKWHAVSILTAEMFELHDRDRFEVHAFDYSPEDGGVMRRRVLAAMEHHIPIHDLSDEEAARLIRGREIDILIDLTGLTSGARPNILAYKPAPVQVSYLGYVGSSGMPEIDYMLADRFVFPESLAASFTEKPLYLPDVYMVNDRKREIGPTPSRSSCGLPEEAFVFCSFNGSYKITPTLYDVWMRILRQVPTGVLWLVADNDAARRNLKAEAQARGVAAERIIFAEKVQPFEYLARYRVVDLVLDTSPYNAGTTASDALWAGQPVLTCPGRAFASRMAGSLLNAVGLPELIVEDWESYERTAVRLANDPQELGRHRRHLEENARSSPLFDTPRFVRNLEAALEGVLAGKRVKPGRSRRRAGGGEAARQGLLIEGWRRNAHPFALVNQHLMLSLAGMGKVRLAHQDRPYPFQAKVGALDGSGFGDEDRKIIESLSGGLPGDPDAVFRICVPYDLSPPVKGALRVFMSCEYGLDADSFQGDVGLKAFQAAGGSVITPSVWARDRIVNHGFDPGSVKVVPLGVNRKYFYPHAMKQIQAQRQALGYGVDEVVLFNVGGAVWSKGMDVLVRAFAVARGTRKDLRLIVKDQLSVYGMKSDKHIVDTLAGMGALGAEALRAITLVPFDLTMDQLRGLYNAADCYVAPYRAEGFSMPVLEALACGTPVMVTAGGATDEYVPPDGLAGAIASTRHERVTVHGRQVDAYCEPSLDHLVELMRQARRKPPMSPRRQAMVSTLRTWRQVADDLVGVCAGGAK